MADQLNQHASMTLFGRVKAFFAEVKTQQRLFYLAFGLLLFVVVVRNTTIGIAVGQETHVFVMKCIKFVVIALLLVKFFLQGLDVRRAIITAVLVLLGFTTFVLTDNEDYLFFAFLFIGASKDIDIRTVAKVSLIVIVPMVLLAAALSLVGLIPLQEGSTANGQARYSMGFRHPNTFGFMIVEICLDLAILRFGKNPAPVVGASIVGAAIVYFIPHSRTSVLILGFLAIFAIVCWLMKMRPRILAGVSFSLFLFVLISTFVLTACFDSSNPVLSNLDSILSYRLDYAHRFYENGIFLFGGIQEYYPGTNEPLPLDMAFDHLLFMHGAVAAIVLIVLIALVFVMAYRQRCFNAALFGLTVFVFYGLSEAFTMYFAYDYFLLAIAPVLYGGRLSDLGASLDVISADK